MARVSGVKEKVHSPLYDAFFVPGMKNGAVAKTFREMMTDPRAIRFFVDVQNKTKLETNLQAAGVLPSLNTFEARAMRVVASTPQKKNDKDGKPVDLKPAEVAQFIGELIYNSVTTLLVGEKTMIEMPTYWFPAGAGVDAGSAAVANNGEPDTLATFRFAEPVPIEPQQNFRVEMLFPQGVPGTGGTDDTGILGNIMGPFRIWVVLDGYLTRDVQ